jgi:hypothetical protein
MWKNPKDKELIQGREYTVMDRGRFVGKSEFIEDNKFKTRHGQIIIAYAVWT